LNEQLYPQTPYGSLWPKEYVVGFTGDWSLTGRLHIQPGSITLTPIGPGVKTTKAVPVHHVDQDVTMVCATLPPWANVHLIVIDESGRRALATGPFYFRKTWRRVLGEAGFRVHEVPTVFGTGRNLKPVRESTATSVERKSLPTDLRSKFAYLSPVLAVVPALLIAANISPPGQWLAIVVAIGFVIWSIVGLVLVLRRRP
jgi:hypothetical protein